MLLCRSMEPFLVNLCLINCCVFQGIFFSDLCFNVPSIKIGSFNFCKIKFVDVLIFHCRGCELEFDNSNIE